MIRIIDLINMLSAYDTDTPVMLGAHYDGYDELKDIKMQDLCYQGIHGESGEWIEKDKAPDIAKERGSLRCITLDW